MNGQGIQIKDLQDVASKTVVSFFKLLTETPKAMIIAKIEKILRWIIFLDEPTYLVKISVAKKNK
jgi:hypothetical protein